MASVPHPGLHPKLFRTTMCMSKACRCTPTRRCSSRSGRREHARSQVSLRLGHLVLYLSCCASACSNLEWSPWPHGLEAYSMAKTLHSSALCCRQIVLCRPLVPILGRLERPNLLDMRANRVLTILLLQLSDESAWQSGGANGMVVKSGCSSRPMVTGRSNCRTEDALGVLQNALIPGKLQCGGQPLRVPLQCCFGQSWADLALVVCPRCSHSHLGSSLGV